MLAWVDDGAGRITTVPTLLALAPDARRVTTPAILLVMLSIFTLSLENFAFNQCCCMVYTMLINWFNKIAWVKHGAQIKL